MKITIKLKNFQYTAEVDNVSVDHVNGDIIISETTTQLEDKKSEEPVKTDIDYKPHQGYATPFATIVKLIKAGYSMQKIGEYTSIPGWKIRRLNNGSDTYCRYYVSDDVKFPIREMPKAGFRRPDDNIPVTLCKECGEPISVEELVLAPTKCYCHSCASKLKYTMPYADAMVNSKGQKVTRWLTQQEKYAVIKLLKLGYSITQIAVSLNISYSSVSDINRGRNSCCKEFPDGTFPIQHNKRELHWDAWRRIQVTYCKECGEPIPVADLLKDPHCEYCPDCKAKHKEE